MRRLFTLLLPAFPTVALLALGATPGRAQTTLSLTGGMSLTSLDAESDGVLPLHLESRTRMSAGLAVTIPVSDRFGLEIGGGYAQKGAGLDMSGILEMIGSEGIPPGARFDMDFEMDYVEFSVLAKVGFPLSSDRVSGYLLAGPALGLQSSCGLAASVSDPGEPALSFNNDCDSGFRKFDAGLTGGAGIDIGLTEAIHARLGLLHALGLTNVIDDDDETMKHRALTIRAGLAFPIG